MNWYDLVAPVYDRAIRSLYLPYRQKAVAGLGLEKGHTVLDLGSDTGLNFELIREAIFPEWQGVFAKSFRLLSAGGRYGVMDLFNDRSTLQS